MPDGGPTPPHGCTTASPGPDQPSTAPYDGAVSQIPPGRLLLLTDVDSTLIRNEVIDLLADEAGCGAEVAAVTERAMRGELDFAASLHARVALLTGLDAAALQSALHRVRYTDGAAELMSTLHTAGHVTAMVSGGFTFFTDRFAAELGVGHAVANELEISDGRLTGRVTGPVVDRRRKAELLREIAAQEGIPMERTVAIGDGANDLDMINTAGMGIAFCAKPALRQASDAVIDEPDLRQVLALLGL